MKRIALIVGLAIFVVSCASGQTRPSPSASRDCVTDFDPNENYFEDRVTVEYAKSFKVSYEKHYKVVEVTPKAASPDTDTYVLNQCGTPQPDLTGNLEGATLIEIPVTSVAVDSTTQVAGVVEIGETNSITGAAGADLITTEPAASRVASGAITDIGNADDSVNFEKAISLDPNVLFTSGFTDLAKVASSGIPTVVDADWQEQTPLGRSEWFVFLSLFYNAEKVANEKFSAIASNYNALADKVSKQSTSQPSLFANTMFSGTWSMPGGDSFAANQFKDAGGNFLWSDDTSAQTLQLSFEAVIDKAQSADLWLQAGVDWKNLGDAAKSEARYANFDAFKNDAVWNFAKITNSAGGIDYLATGAVKADEALADVVKVIHPDLAADHEFVWYQKIPPG